MKTGASEAGGLDDALLGTNEACLRSSPPPDMERGAPAAPRAPAGLSAQEGASIYDAAVGDNTISRPGQYSDPRPWVHDALRPPGLAFCYVGCEWNQSIVSSAHVVSSAGDAPASCIAGLTASVKQKMMPMMPLICLVQSLVPGIAMWLVNLMLR